MVMLDVQDVTLNIPIVDAGRSFRSKFFARYTGGRITHESDREHRVLVRALEGVTFRLEDGDRVGLIGHNGAGKTTLLKVLAGIYEPTSGTVNSVGKITTLFNPSLGMDMDDTGFQNIYNIGLLLGMDAKKIDEKISSIAEFSELGEFLNLPVRTYSSGMLVRLAFSVATEVDPEILLLDEGINAGDARFERQAKQRMFEFYGKLKIMVIATHGTRLLQDMCNKALMLEHGKMVAFGDVDDVVSFYMRQFQPDRSTESESASHSGWTPTSSIIPAAYGLACKREKIQVYEPNGPAFTNKTAGISVQAVAQFGPNIEDGKWYWEIHSDNIGLFDGLVADTAIVGVMAERTDMPKMPAPKDKDKDEETSAQAGAGDQGSNGAERFSASASQPDLIGWGWRADGLKFHGNNRQPWGRQICEPGEHVIMIAVDASERRMWIGVNGTWLEGGDPLTGVAPMFEEIGERLVPVMAVTHGSNGTGELMPRLKETDFRYGAPDEFHPLSGLARESRSSEHAAV